MLFILCFMDEDEVVVIVNDSCYGFGVGVWIFDIGCVFCVF